MTYSPPVEFSDLYKIYTSDPDSMGRHLTVRMSELSKDDPLLVVTGSDAVLFPVDCISHAAMSLVKRLCRQAGKPFVPLRSGGLAPFCAALRHPALSGGDD